MPRHRSLLLVDNDSSSVSRRSWLRDFFRTRRETQQSLASAAPFGLLREIDIRRSNFRSAAMALLTRSHATNFGA
jgi:hypothetical protein